jgi:transcriptional regulator with GAF, ATPase, and Fis domain
MSKFAETKDLDATSPSDHEPWLVVSSSQGVRFLPFPGGAHARIGRIPTCEIQIDDESVSRQHAILHRTEDGLRIEDLGSRNRTKLLGRSLGGGESAPLALGTVVEIGSATMFVQLGRPAAAVSGKPIVAPNSEPSLRDERAGDIGPSSAVIVDPTMQRLYALLDIIAPSPLNVLVLGDTGTGKEIFAEAIHQRSQRAKKRLLRINCAALGGPLLESELFGHEQGGLAGAPDAKPGLFEAADGGTVFLDEIGELPLDTQAKLLRVVERGEVMRIGSVVPRRIDVRYVAATSHDLQQLVNEQRFRADLFFRLNGFSLTLPPLRRRKSEILPLARFFLQRGANKTRAVPFCPDAEQRLLDYAWPGNVRELKSVVERAGVLAGAASSIDASHILLPEVEMRISYPPQDMPRGSAPPPPPPVDLPPMPSESGAPQDLRKQHESWERTQIINALEKTSGNQKEAAKLLGVSRRTLINKIETHGIARPRKR